MTSQADQQPFLSAAERRLAGVLRIVAGVFLALVLALSVLVWIDPVGSAFRKPPWIAGSVAAGVLVAIVAVFAAADPRRRFGLTYALGVILGTAALTQLAYLLAGQGSGRPMGGDATSSDFVMLALLAVELCAAVAVLLAARRVRPAQRATPAPPPSPGWTSDASAGLRVVLPLLGALAAIAAGAAAIGPFVGSLEALLEQPLLSAHAAAGAAGLAALCFYISADMRNRLPLVGGLSLTLLVFTTAALAFDLPNAHLDDRLDVLGASPTVRTLVLGSIASAAAVATALVAARRRAFRIRLRPSFLGATEYRALMALSDVIVRGPQEAVPPAEIASNVDRYFTKIRARRKWVQRAGLIAMQLHPLPYLKAPFSEQHEQIRLDHLKTHFQRDVSLKLIPEVLRRFVQAMIRVANQLAYVGYYSDPRSFASVGYKPFAQRARYAALKEAGKIPTPGRHPLTVESPEAVSDLDIDAGVCVIGSGAAGAVLAYRLAESGEDVVVLERGQYVQPAEFVSDEVEMIGKLYADGVFQQTEDFRFTVLQGSCVGGSTVVNNAVSIRTPERILEHWNERFSAGIEATEFYDCTGRIEQWLHIAAQDPGAANPNIRLNPSYPKFIDGVEKRRKDPDFRLDVSTVRANIRDCIGCGYCNIGCRYGKKLSMLDTVLPWAQRAFGPARVRIYSDCTVRRIVTDGRSPGTATAVKANLPDKRTLTVRARKVVVSAGTVASSYLLQRSGIGEGLPVGHHVSFNMGAPLTAEFNGNLDAYDGLQISHVGIPGPERGWVFETWWNPPVSQALNMPGWFETHYENMRRYRRLMAVGVLVGTERNARIGRALTGGPAIHYVPTQSDMRKLADGLTELGRILFAAGAKEVLLNGWDYYRFTSPHGLYELPAIMRDPSLVTLGTGHPQGGNALSSDPALGPVNPDFRVHGYSNVYVCDASVFPTSITVNPQLTVMSLAEYAAPRIANGAGPRS